MTAYQFSRRTAGTSLLASGLTWSVWTVLDNGGERPPLIVWLLISLLGFVLLRCKQKRPPGEA